MTLVAASKKLIKFDTKTFLSTIDGGREIEAFAKKQAIFAQGELLSRLDRMGALQLVAASVGAGILRTTIKGLY